MPIPVAGFGVGGPADEPDRAAEPFGAPFPRPPKIKSGDRENEESKVAGAGDGFADGAPVAAEGEDAVPIFDQFQGVAGTGGGRLADFAGVGIGVKGRGATGGKSDGRERVVLKDNAIGAGVGVSGADAIQEIGEGKSGDVGRRRRDAAGVALGVGNDLFLKGEGGAGEAQDRNHGAGDESGGEVEPKNGFAKSHGRRRKRKRQTWRGRASS